MIPLCAIFLSAVDAGGRMCDNTHRFSTLSFSFKGTITMKRMCKAIVETAETDNAISSVFFR